MYEGVNQKVVFFWTALKQNSLNSNCQLNKIYLQTTRQTQKQPKQSKNQTNLTLIKLKQSLQKATNKSPQKQKQQKKINQRFDNTNKKSLSDQSIYFQNLKLSLSKEIACSNQDWISTTTSQQTLKICLARIQNL